MSLFTFINIDGARDVFDPGFEDSQSHAEPRLSRMHRPHDLCNSAIKRNRRTGWFNTNVA